LATATNVLLRSELPGIPLLNRGKVRDVYAVDEQRLLIIATDRISAFDVVMPNGIPDKGKVLTQLSLFWFQRLCDQSTHNHLISASVNEYPTPLRAFHEQLEWRSMLVRKVNIMPIECIVRGYLAGSGWKEYRQHGTVCSITLPAGLRESEQLPQPIFTPSTKAESGHDMNISLEEAATIVGDGMAQQLAATSLKLYHTAADYARQRGIIIADTKFEFGLDESDNLILADEVLTPDSSRFWDMERYQPGCSQDSFDKQFVRDYLESIQWNKEPPAPVLPDEVVARTHEKYLEAYQRLVGKALS